MNKDDKSSEQATKHYIKEYKELMSTRILGDECGFEWIEKGDQIEKFTLYDNYTPVKTTLGTGTIN